MSLLDVICMHSYGVVARDVQSAGAVMTELIADRRLERAGVACGYPASSQCAAWWIDLAISSETSSVSLHSHRAVAPHEKGALHVVTQACLARGRYRVLQKRTDGMSGFQCKPQDSAQAVGQRAPESQNTADTGWLSGMITAQRPDEHARQTTIAAAPAQIQAGLGTAHNEKLAALQEIAGSQVSREFMQHVLTSNHGQLQVHSMRPRT